jgi:hypothetical protein
MKIDNASSSFFYPNLPVKKIIASAAVMTGAAIALEVFSNFPAVAAGPVTYSLCLVGCSFASPPALPLCLAACAPSLGPWCP